MKSMKTIMGFLGNSLLPKILCLVMVTILIVSGQNLAQFISLDDEPENIRPDASRATRSSTPSSYVGMRSGGSTYNTSRIHYIHGSSLAGGVASGDLDADGYQEIVVVGGSSEGRVTLIEYDSERGNFTSNLLWWDPDGALVEVAIGELDGSSPGLEIIVGGFSGNLTMLYYNDTTSVNNVTIWSTSRQSENITELNNIFGITVGDIDNRYSGNEIVIADAATNMVHILVNNESTWQELVVPVDDLPRNVFIGDFDNSHKGNELLVSCVNGTVYRLAQEADQWSVLKIFHDSKTAFSAVIDDFNTTHPGDEIIMAGLSWNTTLIWGNGTSWYNNTIWRAAGALEGIAYGEFDQLHDGKELCITGYSNTAVMLYKTASGWYNEIIFTDPDPLQTELNGVSITDFYPAHDGTDLLVIGFSGPVWMLTFEPPDYKLASPSTLKLVPAGEFTTYKVALEIMSGYDSKIELELTGLPEGFTYNFSRTVLEPGNDGEESKDYSVLTIQTYDYTEQGVYSFTVIGKSKDDDLERILNLTINVSRVTLLPDFELQITPTTSILNLSKAEFSTEFKVEIIPINQFDDFVELYIPTEFLASAEVKEKLFFEFRSEKIKPGESSIIKISVKQDLTESFNVTIPIQGKNQNLSVDQLLNLYLEIIYYPPSTTDENGQEETAMHQWVSVSLMGIIIIVILVFLFKRMRDISRQDKQRCEQVQQVRKHDKQIQGRVVRPPGGSQGQSRMQQKKFGNKKND